ncbi:MAG: PHP domain-containing protein [Anaerobiospirillum succiniciproducens]|uniref:PHP domain-containing protein n=1 Tax=Anaerobiospirillum succiniciproducens TaxID=13335 RepID=UPI002A7512EF|nr:PHP domain-containing protein [Anaerobiospirillum succiniciproducens]MDY2797689.1 PHP domain-containing protein [Anaerobiospirillum succiniciproducens]
MTIVSNIDFHCHTNASDGGLSPSELIDRAYGRGLNAIAITDHDLTAGVADAVQRAALLNAKLLNGDADAPVETYIKENAEVNGVDNGELHRAPSERTLIVIPGVEFSTTWYDEQIHIVGLGIDPNNDSLKELEAKLKVARTQRAVAIGEKLKRLGFDRPYERCCEQAREGASITRGNYARLIFQDGKTKSVDDAFQKFLRRGQDAYVKSVWGPIEETIEVIKAAGGIAVLAHPRRYKISNMRLRKLVYEFKKAGGEAIEVSSSQQRQLDRDYLVQLCHKYEMLASLGSDFHNEGFHRDLGQNIDLPSDVTPVWHSPILERYGMGANFKQRLVHITYKKEDATSASE